MTPDLPNIDIELFKSGFGFFESFTNFFILSFTYLYVMRIVRAWQLWYFLQKFQSLFC